MTSTLSEARRSYLVLSDIHLGSRTTPAEEILEHLTEFFDDFRATSPLARVDVIFIAGDLWHDALVFSSSVFMVFLPWFARFLGFCKRHGIALRIMEGTPRHDRKQAATLAKIVEMLNIDIDFRYIADLEIEYVKALGMHVLYVPDECRHTAALVEQDVDRLLDDTGLKEVDIAIMHGMFDHQLGTIPMNPKVHDAPWYLARVRQYLSIGHVHSMSQRGRILAQGSFDRLAHGEEEPKGAMLIQEMSDGDWMHFFLENTQAKIYKTVAVRGTVAQALAVIDKALRGLKDGSHIRIQALATHPIFQGFETLRTKYPQYIFTKKAVAEDEETPSTKPQLPNYTPVILNRETLTDAICMEVANRSELDVEDYHQLRDLLEALHT